MERKQAMKHPLIRSVLLAGLLLNAVGCGGLKPRGLEDSEAWKVIEESDLTVEEILSRHAEAMGGQEALGQLEILKKSGKMSARGMSGVPILTITRYPDRYLRLATGLEKDSFIKVAWDGETVWELSPFIGFDDPTPKTGAEARQIQHAADPTGPLVSPDEKGYQVEVLGKTAKGYKLRVTFNEKDERLYLLDSETFLPSLYLEQRDIQGRLTAETQCLFKDYRPVAGVMVAYYEEVTIPAVDFTQTVFWETIEANVEIDDSEFSM
jgi:hypothetical protein